MSAASRRRARQKGRFGIRPVWAIVLFVLRGVLLVEQPALGETVGVSLPQSMTYHEGRGGSSVLRDSIRLQEVYTSDQFPPSPILIRELRWRPSAAYGRAFTGRLERLQIDLSTTAKQPRSLSRTFARNVGMDRATVFDGPIELQTEFIGPEKGPKAFDIVVPLAQAFLYDSRIGNLLIDIRNHSGGDISFVDAGASSRVGRVFSLGADSEMGTVGDRGGDCIQVRYTEAAPAGAGEVTGLVNGSFEQGIEPGPRANLFGGNQTSIAGWNVEQGTVDYVQGRWKAADGNKCIVLRERSGTAVSQSIRGLMPGRWYEASFALGGNPELNSGSTFLCVSVGGASNRFSVSHQVSNGMVRWRTNFMTFQAPAEAALLRLTSVGRGMAGPLVDGFTLRPLAEPADAGAVQEWHDFALEFRAESNPVGAWRIGAKLTLESPLALLTHAAETNQNGVLVSSWQLADYGGMGIQRAVGWTGRPGTTNPPPIRAVIAREDAEEQYCVARFTVPVGGAGTYRVEAVGREDASEGGRHGAEFRLMHNNRERFGRLLAAGVSGSFTNDVELRDGDVVDFLVGDGWKQAEPHAEVQLTARVGRYGPRMSRLSGAGAAEIRSARHPVNQTP